MSGSLNCNGVELAYEVRGSGRDVLFLHGFLANGTGPYYDEFKGLLAGEYRVHSIDMRSHGGSKHISDGLTFEHLPKDIVAAVETLEIEEALVIGHSMGGFLAMASAIINPSRFRALVAITPAQSRGAPTEEIVPDFMAARASRALMHERFGAMFVQPPREARLDILRDAALCLPDSAAEHWIRNEWPNTNITDRLTAIDIPVLTLIGMKDVVVSPMNQYEDVVRLPRAKAVSFTDEGHMLPVEKPELCYREILRFEEDLS